jgi:hypothetical protein
VAESKKGGKPALAAGYTSTVKKRALGKLLIKLRDEADFKFSEASLRAHVSPTTLNQLQHGTWVKPVGDHVRALLELFGVDEEVKEQVLQVAFEAREPGWWQSKRFKSVFPNQFPGHEAAAAVIRTFENGVVPGLFQTAEYIEYLNEISATENPEAHTEGRLNRQKILNRDENPPRVHAVIDESAIVRIPPALRDGQLRRLRDLSEGTGLTADVTIQIIPLDAYLYPDMGEVFTHLEYTETHIADLVYLESTIDSRTLERPEESADYYKRFGRLCRAALDPDETRAYLRQKIK